jgi:hypothetical protein
MKKKTLNIINNPRLDRIFSDAYRNTMKQVAEREQDKHDEDYYKTFSGLFEQDLYNRDLTSAERQEFMETFHREIESLQEDAERRHKKNKKVYLIGGSVLLSAAALSIGIYIAAVRPFMPVEKITTDLSYYLMKVVEGSGSYSKKFYALIEKQGQKLTLETEAAYRSDMYNSLDNHFDDTIARLEAGEVRYYDDAKDWASRFPEAEERVDRKEVAENAFKKGLGTAVGKTLEDVKEGAKNLFTKAADFIKDLFRRSE